jgi:hypothetical protein
MGQETHCIATWNGKRSVGRALLETDELVFRGEFRLKLPFKSILELGVTEGQLSVRVSEGTATFNLGPRAQQWAERIRNPRGLLDKLGIRPEMTVSVMAVRDQWFLDELQARVANVRLDTLAKNSDVIIAGLESSKDLSTFTRMLACLKSDGAIWAVRRRGAADLTEAAVMEAAREAGLVDVKVARFSDTHTAEKFVRPRFSR